MKIDVSKITTIHIGRLYLISRMKIANSLFCIGMGLAFFASFSPWFLWPILKFYMVISAVFVMASMIISRTLQNPIFTESKVLLPTIVTTLLFIYERIAADANIIGFIAAIFNSFLFYSLFRYDNNRLYRLTTTLTKILAAFLIVSITMYILYLVGFPLPGVDTQFGDNKYSFTNYYFFMVDDRTLVTLFPRFQSVALEPSHIGVPCALLLQAQRGHWKKWYNIVIITTLLISFSLGAYVYFIVILFLNAWCNRRKILAKILVTVTLVAAIVAGSFFYNNGDNLLHDLIILRLEVSDGELEGNNRTDIDFDKEFESYMKSKDMWTGRELKDDTGNSGAKVYIYRYGIIGLVIFIVFIFATLSNGKDKRCSASAIIIAFLIFFVDAFVTWYCRYIPLLCTSKLENIDNDDKKEL